MKDQGLISNNYIEECVLVTVHAISQAQISLSEYEIELGLITLEVVLNESALTTLPYQLPDHSQELLGVARSSADKKPSAASRRELTER